MPVIALCRDGVAKDRGHAREHLVGRPHAGFLEVVVDGEVEVLGLQAGLAQAAQHVLGLAVGHGLVVGVGVEVDADLHAVLGGVFGVAGPLLVVLRGVVLTIAAAQDCVVHAGLLDLLPLDEAVVLRDIDAQALEAGALVDELGHGALGRSQAGGVEVLLAVVLVPGGGAGARAAAYGDGLLGSGQGAAGKAEDEGERDEQRRCPHKGGSFHAVIPCL